MPHWTRSDWPEFEARVARMFEIAPDDVIILTSRVYEDGYSDWHLIFWVEDGVAGIALDDETIAELGLDNSYPT